MKKIFPMEKKGETNQILIIKKIYKDIEARQKYIVFLPTNKSYVMLLTMDLVHVPTKVLFIYFE